MDYLKIPLDFSELIKEDGGGFNTCSLEESIAQYLMMIITSKYGEVVGKPRFGSEIWELEFNQLVKINKWEEKVRESLQKTIVEHEKRLKDIEVSVRLSEVDTNQESADQHVRRKAEIKVVGKIVETDTFFNFGTLLYISPLSQ